MGGTLQANGGMHYQWRRLQSDDTKSIAVSQCRRGLIRLGGTVITRRELAQAAGGGQVRFTPEEQRINCRNL
jgi:hypothetical protein